MVKSLDLKKLCSADCHTRIKNGKVKESNMIQEKLMEYLEGSFTFNHVGKRKS